MLVRGLTQDGRLEKTSWIASASELLLHLLEERPAQRRPREKEEEEREREKAKKKEKRKKRKEKRKKREQLHGRARKRLSAL